MKPVRLILTRMNGIEMLTIKQPLSVGIAASRFVIEDLRGKVVETTKRAKPKVQEKAR